MELFDIVSEYGYGIRITDIITIITDSKVVNNELSIIVILLITLLTFAITEQNDKNLRISNIIAGTF